MAEETYTETENPSRVDDPAPNPIDVARQQAEQIVKNIGLQASLYLRSRRDELDNLMANIDRSGSALMHYIGEYADRCSEAIAIAENIRKEIDAATSPFSKNPPATLTQTAEEPKS